MVLFVSLALLLVINIWQGRFIKRLHGGAADATDR
ncbi:hypothetical protein Q427_27720 [Halomonas sp. BC04]|nr:hypothetical protein Q427_27720 [Halomonas sp. BC04]